MIPASLCISCKGRLWCKLPACPILEKFSQKQSAVASIQSNRFEGSSPPGVFVSWTGYPKVSIAPMAPPVRSKESRSMDDPETWFGLPSSDIVQFRSALISAKTPMRVGDAKNPSRTLSTIQEISMSREPVDADFSLKHKPSVSLAFHEGVAPTGPSAPLAKLSLLENPSVPAKVEALVADTDAKSAVAIEELYDKDFSVHYLSKLLSAGTLGVGKNRKLVPTRWSITAIDSNVSEFLIDDTVKDQPELGEVRLFQAGYLDNRFFVLLVPRAWSFEMLECWLPGSAWTLEDPRAQKADAFQVISDHEFYDGRTTYADKITGAYYAARLAVAEYLVREKRQAAALIFREIGQGYAVPLGVWVIRETVRKALSGKPIAFSDLSLALSYVSARLSAPFAEYKKESQLIPFFTNQKRLSEFR